MGRFERQNEMNRDRTVLERIVALLLSLAMLADRAAARSMPVRREVLDILVHGEAEARGLIVAMVAGSNWNHEPAEAAIPDLRDSAEDAALLAARLRVLALVLYAMLSAARDNPGRTVRRYTLPAYGLAHSSCGWHTTTALPAPDTS